MALRRVEKQPGKGSKEPGQVGGNVEFTPREPVSGAPGRTERIWRMARHRDGEASDCVAAGKGDKGCLVNLENLTA